MDEFDVNNDTLGRKSAKGIAALASRTLILNLISFATSLVIFTIFVMSETSCCIAKVHMQNSQII